MMASNAAEQNWRPVKFLDVRIIAHSGYRGNECPKLIAVGEKFYAVKDVLKQWREPVHEYFQLHLENGDQMLLRHTLDNDDWETIPKDARD